MKTFRCYQMSKELYKECLTTPVKGAARDQLHRAMLSVCLTLAEGSAKASQKERRRFYSMSLASMREVQAIIDLHNLPHVVTADILGASIYKLILSLDSELPSGFC